MASWSAHIRTYGIETPQERHDYVQMVLPLIGEIELDIAGRQALVGGAKAAAVPSQMLHTQRGLHRHQALILNIDTKLAGECGFDQLQEQRYFTQTKSAQHMTRLLARAVASKSATEASLPYAISLCALGRTQIENALLAIEDVVSLAPLNGLTVQDMALACDLKPSQFHDVFRRHFGKSPHQWLVEKRLNAVRQALETTDIALKDLAQLAGYSDQTALTRAFRNHFGIALSEYRQMRRD